MGNPLIEGPIPLAGPGFIPRENGNFQPGEYKRLSNLELDAAGVLVNRRNVYSVNGTNTGSAVEPIINPQRFIGNMGEYSILTTGEDQLMVGDSVSVPLWTLNDGAGPVGVSSYSIFLGFFRYNNMNFWLVFEFDSAVSVGLVLYHDAAIPVPDIPETYAAGYEASLTRVEILTFASGSTDFYEFQFKNFFVYKERLWIATSVGLYFSGATDPTDFVPPNGGFFKHPGNRVNYAFAIKDQIYTLCDDAVYSLTYNTDPNLDATERPLSDTIGGEMGCIHLDTPYFINNLGIFVINGNNVDKVMDSRFDYGRDTYRNHLYSFEEYLVIQKYNPINYDNNYSPPARVTTRQNLIQSPESDAVGGSQIIDGWVVSSSGAITTRANKQINPNLVIDPNDDTVPDYFASTLGTDFDIGHTTFAYLGTHGGFIDRASSTGVLDIKWHVLWMSADPLTDYAISCYVYTPIAETVELKINYDLADTSTFDSDIFSFDIPAQEWTRISAVVNTPVGTELIHFGVTYKSVSGIANRFFDAVLVEQTDTVKSYFDGSFPDDDFKTYSWTGDGVADKNGSELVVATVLLDPVSAVDDSISTGKVLEISGTFVDPADLEDASTEVWAKVIKTFEPDSPLTSGIPYTFRFDYKSAGTWDGAQLEVMLEFLSATDVVLGTSNHVISASYSPSPTYQTYLLDSVVFPLTATKMRVSYTFTLDVASAASTTDWSLDFNKFLLEKTSTYSGYFTGATADTDDVTYTWAATAFESESTTGSATSHSYLHNNGNKFEPFVAGNSLGYNTYFVNTDNGATHVLDFMDQYDGFGRGQAGFIVDCIVNPNSDDSGNYKIMFITNKHISEDETGLSYESYVYFISSSEDVEVYDFAVNSAGLLTRRPPKIDVEWDSLVPDGSEYRVKKYRSLMMMGIMPIAGMQLEVAFDDSNAVQTWDLSDNIFALDAPRSHYAHRIGLNQRGRSLTLRLRNLLWNEEIDSNYGPLEISDMRVLWSYTSRHPTSRFIGS